MKISIALCTYNGEEFLLGQLDSILSQSLMPGEIIICDDGSKDSTMQILRSFESKYENIIKVHQNKTNLGFVKNFEKAISLCTGDIIFLSDQDDVWKKNKIEKFVRVFDENPKCLYVFSDAQATNEKGKYLNYTLWKSVKFTAKKQKLFMQGFQKELLLKKNFVQGASLAIRADTKKIILPFVDNFFHDHWIVQLLSLIYLKAGILINESLILYRMHIEQNLGLDNRNFIIKKLEYFKNLFHDHTEEFNNRINKITEIKTQLSAFEEFPKENKEYLSDLVFFYKTRNQMYKENKLKRFKLILYLLKNGYYKKFSHSNFVAYKEMFEKLILNSKISETNVSSNK